MPWLKQDDGMGEHRKTRRLLKRGKAGAGLAGFGLHSLGMLHAAKYLTDGFLEVEFVEDTLDDANVTGKSRQEIVTGLVDSGQWTVVDDGYLIHDYLDHNPSRAEVESKRATQREQKSAAGRKGAAARWGHETGPSDDADSSVPSACQANDGEPVTAANSPDPTRPDPLPSDTRPTAAAARAHTRETVRIHQALETIARRRGLDAPSVDEVASALEDLPDKDATVALADLQKWAARPDKPRDLTKSLRKALDDAPKATVVRQEVFAISPATDEDHSDWAKARTTLESTLSAGAWGWLEPLRLVGLDGDALVLDGGLVAGWVAQPRFTDHIVAALDGRPVRITGETAEAAA